MKILNIIDDFSREAITIQPGFSITSRGVANILGEIQKHRGLPEAIVMDNGPEFTGKDLHCGQKKTR